MPAQIIVLAGVNGAGKSSVAGATILEQGGAFYNPDEAARKLRERNPGLTLEIANSLAWEKGRSGLERALTEGGNFAFETTLGARTIPDLLLDGARRGAEIHVSYVGLESVQMHLQRVARRVAAGGHPIPAARIRERFRTSRENLILLLPHLSSLRVYDNSAEADPKVGHKPQPALLLRMEGGQVTWHIPLGRVPKWAKPILAAALTMPRPKA